MLENGGCIGCLPRDTGMVTSSAGSPKGVLMGIVVTRRAILERNAFIFYDRVCSTYCPMAFCTWYVFMCLVESKTCLPVVEVFRLFPILRSVASLTLERQLTLMGIGVTAQTILRKA